MIFNFPRCGWQLKDLRRFICLKIWPRLPNQSKRAIQVLHDSADSNDQRTYSSAFLYARPAPLESGGNKVEPYQRSDDNVFKFN